MALLNGASESVECMAFLCLYPPVSPVLIRYWPSLKTKYLANLGVAAGKLHATSTFSI
jgi:hypothetical protein